MSLIRTFVIGSILFLAPSVARAVQLTVDVSGSGTGTILSTPAGINCGSDCTQDYPSGTVVTLTPVPDAEFTFAGWQGVDCPTPAPCTFTMQFPGTVVAVFDAENEFPNTTGTPTTPPDATTTPSSAGAPDLTGTVTKTTVRVKPSGHKLMVKPAICNEGNGEAEAFEVKLYLSNDASWDDSDEQLDSFTIESLAPSACLQTDPAPKFKTKRLSSLDGRFALVVIDPGSAVAGELNTTNNVLSEALEGPFLSSGKRIPGQFLTIADDSIAAGSTIEVTFSGANGYVVNTTTSLTTSGQAKVAVPPFLDPITNTFVAGTVSVEISGSNGRAQLKIKELPEVDGTPGAVTREVIGFMRANLDGAQANIESVSSQSGEDFSEWLDMIVKISIAAQAIDSDLANQQLNVATDTESTVLDREELILIDRLMAAYILGMDEELQIQTPQSTVAKLSVMQSGQRALTTGTVLFDNIANALQRLKKTSIAKVKLVSSFVSVTGGVLTFASAVTPGAQGFVPLLGVTSVLSSVTFVIGSTAVSVTLDTATNLVKIFDHKLTNEEVELVDVSANAVDEIKGGLISVGLSITGAFKWAGATIVSVISLADDTHSGVQAARVLNQCDETNNCPSPTTTDNSDSASGSDATADSDTAPDSDTTPTTTDVFDVTVSVPGFSVDFSPSGVIGGEGDLFVGAETVPNVPSINAAAKPNGGTGAEFLLMQFDPRQISGPGTYTFSTIIDVFFNQAGAVGLVFSTLDITDVSDNPVSLLSTGGTMTLTVYKPGSGGRLAGSFTATVEGQQVTKLPEGDEDPTIVTLTGTITASFDAPIE